MNSLYAHLDTVSGIAVGDTVSIGTQVGTLGNTGEASLAHLHFEMTAGDILPTSDDGYNPSGAPIDWFDPIAFINANLESGQPPTLSPFDFSGTSPESWEDILLMAHFAIDAYNGSGGDAVSSFTSLPAANQITNTNEWRVILSTVDGGQRLVDPSGNNFDLWPTNLTEFQATAYQEILTRRILGPRRHSISRNRRL